ncbi:MAG TPA: DUF1631 family protein [Xanthomonadaceae bacterium]|nr:DUF1631 family protein [Xanthomonadaceae bacterium]
MTTQSGIARPETACTDPVRLLEDLRRAAVEQLGAVPGGLYRPIEEQLQAALRNSAPGAQRRDLMTVLALRQRGSSYVMRYRELVARSFEDFRGRFSLSRGGSPLGLVRENELDFHLAGQRLAESIARRYQRELEVLDARFEALARALDAPPTSNPVGAARLAGAFLQTFRDAEISESLQPLLFRQYEMELGRVLGELYARMNALLAAAGFDGGVGHELPVPGPEPRPAPVEAGPAAGAQASQRLLESILNRVPHGSADEAPAGRSDLFRVSAEARVQHQRTRDLLRAWRAARVDAPAPAPLAQAGMRELRVQEITTVAALLQAEGPRAFEAALAGDGELQLAIREQLAEGARRLGIDPDHARLGEQQEDAIDLVGLTFESLLRSHALVANAHKLYARLVMPYVRVAIADENLFVRPDHPARRLLDALTLSCESNDGASPQDRELLQHAGRVVERVVAEYNEDLAIFELAANELHDLLQQQRRRAEVVERRSADTVHGRERLLQARLQAASALAAQLAGRTLTSAVAKFLEEPWQHHLVQVLLREGVGSPLHVRAIALGQALVVADAAAARHARAEVARQLLALEQTFNECLASSGLDEQAAAEWMAELARALGFPDHPREQRPAPALQMGDESEDTRLLQVVGGHGSLDFEPEVAQRMRALQPGVWLRLVDERGEEGSVKVAWVSPLTSRLLLVNRRGVRKLVASPEQLAALVKAGNLMLEAADLPFDEAMRQVRRRLDAAAQAA